MRTLLFLAVLLLAPAAQAQSLESLAWLEGCWRTRDPGPVITEVWSAPPMPALVGYSYTTLDGRTEGWEQTRVEIIDGWPHFVAMPNGGAPVRFRLHDPNDVMFTGAQPDGIAVFENPEHDYPQTVSYMRFGDRLRASIAGAAGADRIQFEFRRIPCSAELRP